MPIGNWDLSGFGAISFTFIYIISALNKPKDWVNLQLNLM